MGKTKKYRKGIKQIGYWYIPNTWKGPFGINDEIFFREFDGGWKMHVNVHRHDGYGLVLVDTFIYNIPKWMQNAIQDTFEFGHRVAKNKAIAKIEGI